MNPTATNKRSKKALLPIAGIVLTLLILGGAIFSVLAFRSTPSNQTPVSTGQPTDSGSLPSGVAEPTCTAGGPCTELNDGSSSGCDSSGPCTQNSNGETIVDGTITAVSATSITIRPSTGGNTQTYAITSATQKEAGGGSSGTFNSGDVRVGDSIGIALSSDRKQAVRIMLGFNVQVQQR